MDEVGDEVGPSVTVRVAVETDADDIGRLLYDFNREYDEPTPPPAALAARLRQLMTGGDTTVLLVGAGPDALAVLRFRPSLWSEHLECYLAELYVVPPLRGRGIGRQLMTAVLEQARAQGADHIDLGTSEADIAALGLYRSFGFTNRESLPDGPIMYVYEREL